MCVKPYYGWRCGHRHPSATELPFQPCGPPERYPHEPLCSPPTYKVIVCEVPEKDEEDEDDDVPVPLEEWQEGICPACCEVYSRVDEKWYARREALIDSGTASERHLDIVDERLYDCAISVLEKGQRAGPDHTLHLDEYELKQEIVLWDMDRLLEDVKNTKDYFRDSYARIQGQGQLPDELTFEYLRRYVRAEIRRKELSQEETDRFAKTIRRYVEELDTALANKIASSQAAGAARQSPEADPLSDIPAEFAEGEPEGEAGSSDE